MAEKKVCIIVKSPPFSRINYYEALRVAVGLWEHQVTMIWMGDGVYATLKKGDQTLTQRFLKDLSELGIESYVEKEALEKRGFESHDVITQASIIDRGKIAELLMNVQHSLVF